MNQENDILKLKYWTVNWEEENTFCWKQKLKYYPWNYSDCLKLMITVENIWAWSKGQNMHYCLKSQVIHIALTSPQPPYRVQSRGSSPSFILKKEKTFLKQNLQLSPTPPSKWWPSHPMTVTGHFERCHDRGLVIMLIIIGHQPAPTNGRDGFLSSLS